LWSNVLLGFGQSVAFTPMTMLAFSTLAKAKITEGATIFTLMRNFGSSIFISLAVLVLLRTTTQSYSNISEKISVFSGGGDIFLLPSLWSLENLFGLSQLSNEVQRQASMIGYINSFHMMAFVALAAVPLVAFMSHPLSIKNKE
jgi:DHA2 family multidrug resistance protein